MKKRLAAVSFRFTPLAVLTALVAIVAVPLAARAEVDVTVTVDPAPASPAAPDATAPPIRFPRTGADVAGTLAAALAMLAAGLVLLKLHSTQQSVPANERTGS